MERDRKVEFFIASLSALGLWTLAFSAAFSKRQRSEWFMKEFNATCQECGRKWDDGWMLEYDHITPQSEGGPDTLDNANLVCQDCHADKHEEAGDKAAAGGIRGRMKKNGGKRKGW